MDMEIWRPVLGFEDYYEVSSQGRVLSLERMTRIANGNYRRKAPHILSQRRVPQPRGGIGNYICVKLCVDRQQQQKFVHILVLEAFVEPRPPGAQTRHLNGIPDDNSLANLCWGTAAENLEDTLRHGTIRRGSAHNAPVKQNKLSEADIPIIRAACKAGLNQRMLAGLFKVSKSTIWYVVKRGWAHV